MAVPSFDKFISPLLSFLGRQSGPVRASDAHEAVAELLGLTAADRAERLPSGVQSLYANRNAWAHDRLKRADLSSSVRRGLWLLSEEGRALAAQHPGGLPASLVAQLASVARDPSADAPERGGSTLSSAQLDLSPDDRIHEALREIRENVADDLLSAIARESPAFFERLVLDLLHKMGYGAGREALERVGGSGDGGIDGVISLDRLGLQKVYVQAKRWVHPVGDPEVRNFIGSLTAHGADKGVFLTTSKFTAKAADTAAKLQHVSVVLIDGPKLAQLMIDFVVGVSEDVVKIPKLDSDYFQD